MNSKQAKRLHNIAFLISPEGSTTVTKTGYVFDAKGKPIRPYSTTYYTGTRATYQRLKKNFTAVPRERRVAFLEGLESALGL